MLVRVNAKINLHLELKGERPDGFHEIDSIFQSVSLPDFIDITKSKDSEYLGTLVAFELKDELVYRAHKAVELYTDKDLPCKISLTKNIPVAAGLGGGSADAAGVIVGLNQLYDLKLSEKQLCEIAEKVGSDVPFFVIGGTCQVSGRGEVLKPIKVELSKYFVLARPHKRISTKEMYEHHRLTKKTFFEICQELCPDVTRLHQHFSKYEIKEIGLSGSGPTMFCGVDSYALASQIAFDLKDFNGDIYLTEPREKGIEIV